MAKKENKNVHEVTIKIEGESWEKALDRVFKEKQKTVKVDGFRKGKVPRSVFEKKFGKESLYFDAANAVLEEAYTKVMTDSKLIPVVQPAVDIKDITDKGVEFIFRIVTKPEVKVKKYKGLGVKPEKVKVTKEEIEHELGHLLERYTELVTKEGKVENGDVAIIDFEGFKDGVAFDGGKGENYSLEIGSNTFIPGFEEQIIGMKTGDEKDLKVTFPEDYGAADLAGAPVVFKVKVNEIKEKKERELDEDFFEDLGMDGIDSEEKLKEEIKKSLEAQKEMDAENKYVDTLLETVSKNVDVLNVKLDKNNIIVKLSQNGFYPAYHMNKKNWISIVLDETLSDEIIMECIRESYHFSLGNNTEKSQKEWIVPANPKYYDIQSTYVEGSIQHWKQSSNIQVGDIVYIYVGAPVSAILYQCEVLKCNIPYSYHEEKIHISKMIEIKVLKVYDNDFLPFSKLKEYQINAVRGPRFMPKLLSDYIKKHERCDS